MLHTADWNIFSPWEVTLAPDHSGSYYGLASSFTHPGYSVAQSSFTQYVPAYTIRVAVLGVFIGDATCLTPLSQVGLVAPILYSGRVAAVALG